MKFDYFENWRYTNANTIFERYSQKRGFLGRKKTFATPGLIDCFIDDSLSYRAAIQKPQDVRSLSTSSEEKVATLDGVCVKIHQDFYVRKPLSHMFHLGETPKYQYIKIDHQTGMPKLRREIYNFYEIKELLKVQPLFIEQIDASSLAMKAASDQIGFFGVPEESKLLHKGKDDCWHVDCKAVLEEIAQVMSSSIDRILSSQMSMGVEFNANEAAERQRFSDLLIQLFENFTNDFKRELQNRIERRCALGIDGHIRMAPELSLPDVTEKKNTQLVACKQKMIEPKNPESEQEMGM